MNECKDLMIKRYGFEEQELHNIYGDYVGRRYWFQKQNFFSLRLKKEEKRISFRVEKDEIMLRGYYYFETEQIVEIVENKGG